VAEKIGGGAIYIHLDVSKEADWETASHFIEKEYGPIDIVINNAGITGFLETFGPHDPENLDMDSWHKVHETNLDGVALGCKYGIRLMKNATSASIVNISSRSGLVGIPAATAYASSKGRRQYETPRLACRWALWGTLRMLPMRRYIWPRMNPSMSLALSLMSTAAYLRVVRQHHRASKGSPTHNKVI
jgi:NAD(P)-dependent dehydrogenase (short-subunit alcohol dehydrogenase family)